MNAESGPEITAAKVAGLFRAAAPTSASLPTEANLIGDAAYWEILRRQRSGASIAATPSAAVRQRVRERHTRVAQALATLEAELPHAITAANSWPKSTLVRPPGFLTIAEILEQLLASATQAAPFFGEPPKRGRPAASDLNFLRYLERFVDRQFRAAGRPRLSLKSEGPKIKAIAAAVELIDGSSNADPERIASALRRAKKGGRNSRD